MIYNTRNWSNDITESRKEKRPDFMFIFSTVSKKSQIVKVYILGIRHGY